MPSAGLSLVPKISIFSVMMFCGFTDDEISHSVRQLQLQFKCCSKYNSSASTLCKDSSDVKEQEGENWGGTKVNICSSSICLHNGHVSLAQNKGNVAIGSYS